MIDIRYAELLDFCPESIRNDPNVIALSRAIDLEQRAVAEATIEANILARIPDLDEPVLDEIAWSCRFVTLQVWDLLSVAGKRTLLSGVFHLRKRSGTKYAVMRVFSALALVAQLVEWFEESEAPYTYRIRITVDEIGLSLSQEVAVYEWVRRFERASAKLREIAVQSDRVAPVGIASAPESGRHVEISYGAP
jgi:phage tail P2-like protein